MSILVSLRISYCSLFSPKINTTKSFYKSLSSYVFMLHAPPILVFLISLPYYSVEKDKLRTSSLCSPVRPPITASPQQSFLKQYLPFE